MSFFWPTRANPFPGFFGRVGRIAHYASFIVAIYVAWVFWSDYSFNSLPGRFPTEASTDVLGMILALAIPMGGRAIRYIFAGE